jgi:hypothetical protein
MKPLQIIWPVAFTLNLTGDFQSIGWFFFFMVPTDADDGAVVIPPFYGNALTKFKNPRFSRLKAFRAKRES